MSRPPYSAIRAAVLSHPRFCSVSRIDDRHWLVTLRGDREVGIRGESFRQAIEHAHEYLEKSE